MTFGKSIKNLTHLLKGQKRVEIELPHYVTHILQELIENTDAEDDTDVIQDSLKFYLGILRSYAHQRVILFVSIRGMRPRPVHIANPKELLESRLCNTGESLKLSLTFNRKSRGVLEEMRRISMADSYMTVVENALVLYYSVFQRTLRGELFFLRNPNTSKLEPVVFWKAVWEKD